MLEIPGHPGLTYEILSQNKENLFKNHPILRKGILIYTSLKNNYK